MPMHEHKPHRGEAGRRLSSLLETVGTHPLGTVAGGIGGALLGFVAGMAAGPVGSLLGAIGGAVAGIAVGSSANVGPVDVSAQDRYWRDNYAARPYVPAAADYADYGPAYRHGARASLKARRPRDWHRVEADLGRRWERNRESSRLGWDEAKPAVRDAWDRVQGSAR